MAEGRMTSSMEIGDRASLLRRETALKRFAAWEALHPATATPEAALNGIGLLYELLPPESRSRPVDTSGVQQLHRCLAVLNRRST
jgi:hypothetical protein